MRAWWKSRRWIAWASAAVAAGLGLWLRFALESAVGGSLPTYITFYPAVMIVALLGGLGPGLLATMLSALVTAQWVLDPPGLAVEGAPNILGVALFGAMGTLMSVVAGLYRRARGRAALLARELELKREVQRQKDLLAAALAGIGESQVASSPHIKIGNLAWIFIPLSAAAALVGGFMLAAWLSGAVAGWSATTITMKTNMALGLLLAGLTAILLARDGSSAPRRWAGLTGAVLVLLLGSLLLSQHLAGWDLGIDQLLAKEPPGAVATVSPNRVGLPGSSSLTLLGGALVLLGLGRRRAVPYLAAAVVLVNVFPAVGFLYGIWGFYGTRVGGVAGPTVLCMMCLGLGLVLRCPDSGLVGLLRRDDAGGKLLRGTLPAALLLPLALGFLRVVGQHQGLYDTPTGTGLLVLTLMLIFSLMLWRSAEHLSRTDGQQRRAREEMREHKQLLAVTLASIGDAVIVTDTDGHITFLNSEAERLTGWSNDQAGGQPVPAVFKIVNEQTRQTVENPVEKVLRLGIVVGLANHTILIAKDGHETAIDDSGAPVRTADGTVHGVVLVFRDITERKVAEEEREIAVEFLGLVNRASGIRALVQEAVHFFREQSECEAVGIRLREGDDYPYYETRGFPEQFVRLESSLCCRGPDGGVERDAAGNAVLACMCGNVIHGRFDPAQPFFTPAGSFWTNSTTQLLTSTTDADRQARNRCNGEGYESVALIALRIGEERLGLLQLNDRRAGRFTPQTIALWERLAGYMAVALSRAQAEEALHRSHQDLAAANEELQASAEELQANNEALQAANEELHVAEEELTAQNHSLVEAQQALRESRERLWLALRSASMGAWRLDLRGRTRDFDEQVCRCLGIDPSRFAGTADEFYAAVHPADRDGLKDSLARTVATGAPYEVEYRVVWPDGSTHYVAARGRLARDSAGQPQRINGLAWDITERKQAEEALRRSQEQYHTLFNTLTEGFCVIEVLFDAGDRPIDYRFLEINPAFEAQSGLHGAEGKRMRELAPAHEAHWFEIYGKVALTGQPVRFVNEAKALGRWFDVSAYRVGGAGSRKVAVIFNDITERKRVELDLEAAKTSAEQAKAAAEHANAAKDHFLAVLSHELRTPLTPVLTTADMLTRDASLPERYRQDVEMVRRNVELEARLIDDLLDVTRITRGKLELHRQPVMLAEVIRRSVEVCEGDIEARRLEFGVDLGDARDVVVQADAARLQQVFWNLLKNAIKFTPPGGCVGIRCRKGSAEEVASGQRAAGGEEPAARRQPPAAQPSSVIVEINDSGAGIDPELLPRLFSPFEQGGAGVTRQFGGLGLGLTITKGLVEMHGGSIAAHSPGPGKGATFAVTLPVFLAEPNEAPDSSAPSALSTQHPALRRPLRILLVEDHGDTARIMKRLLEMEGHAVETAGDVARGLELGSSRPFDLLISDLGLPDGAGTDLMRELVRCGKPLPAIALSGYGREEDVRRSKEAGFLIHLTKPTSPERLYEAIATAVGAGAGAG